MPVNVPNDLPAIDILRQENIFVMTEERAVHQDIRPLEVLILNLMPTKLITETQLLRVLGNTPLQVNVTLMHMENHLSKNTPAEHLITFYRSFEEIKDKKFDGFIITGAPVEQMQFEDVDYWQDLIKILNWRASHVFSTLYICWGAQAALYYRYHIKKYPLEKKMFGVFQHQIVKKHTRLLRGFDDIFYAPVSRHTEVRVEDITQHPELETLCISNEAGLFLAQSCDEREIFVTGHAEYDPDTLQKEYVRDLYRDLPIDMPRNYFPEDNPEHTPLVRWRAHANLLFSNWLNYYVYQETPYSLDLL